MRTKTTLLTAALASILLLAGCSGSPETAPTASTTPTAEETPVQPAQATATPAAVEPAPVDDREAKVAQFVRAMQGADLDGLDLSDDEVRAAVAWVCANTRASGYTYDPATTPIIIGAEDWQNISMWSSTWANGLCE